MTILPSNDSRGFTLLEVLFSVVIMAIGLLGLLEAVNISMSHNLRNQFRAEAASIGERVMNEQRHRAFDNITGTRPITIRSDFRGAAKEFTVRRSYVDLSSDSRQIQLEVWWSFKNVSTVNRVVSVKSR